MWGAKIIYSVGIISLAEQWQHFFDYVFEEDLSLVAINTSADLNACTALAGMGFGDISSPNSQY
jgi:hypothetical protein